jgi:hypothetical protein
MTNLKPWAEWTEEEIEDGISLLSHLSSHGGYRLLAGFIEDELTRAHERLAAEDSRREVHRLQGAARAFATTLSLRVLLLNALEERADQIEADKAGAREEALAPAPLDEFGL